MSFKIILLNSSGYANLAQRDKMAHMKKYVIYIGLVVIMLCGGAMVVSAHDVQYASITSSLTLNGASADFVTVAPELISAGDESTPESEKNEIMSGVFSENFQIAQNGSLCPVTITSIALSEEKLETTFQGRITCSETIDVNNVRISSTLFSDIFPTYDHFVTITSGKNVWQLAFNAERQIYPDTVALVQHSSPLGHFMTVVWEFLWMGMKHIFTGYDHILFLLAAILLMRSPRSILILVTSFTIAHTITLLLAAFGKINISPSIVEPLIALSILYMTLRNMHFLWFKKEHEHVAERWITTFGFGLIHGLGFAGSLTETNIPQEFFVSSLISFNVGIELGQIIILLVVVPLLMDLDKHRRRNVIFIIASTAIAVVSLFWLVQRLIA